MDFGTIRSPDVQLRSKRCLRALQDHACRREVLELPSVTEEEKSEAATATIHDWSRTEYLSYSIKREWSVRVLYGDIMDDLQ